MFYAKMLMLTFPSLINTFWVNTYYDERILHNQV